LSAALHDQFPRPYSSVHIVLPYFNNNNKTILKCKSLTLDTCRRIRWCTNFSKFSKWLWPLKTLCQDQKRHFLWPAVEVLPRPTQSMDTRYNDWSRTCLSPVRTESLTKEKCTGQPLEARFNWM